MVVWNLIWTCTSPLSCLCSDDFGVAKKKAKKAEETSDLDTAASEAEEESRKCRARTLLEGNTSPCSSSNANKSRRALARKSQFLLLRCLHHHYQHHCLHQLRSPPAGSSLEASHRSTASQDANLASKTGTKQCWLIVLILTLCIIWLLLV